MKRILFQEDNKKTKGVELKDGTKIEADFVLSNATPKVTFLDLIDPVRLHGKLKKKEKKKERRRRKKEKRNK